MECSDKKKEISIFLGFTGGFYKFSISDNGTPFSKEILNILGKEKVTTRIDGSGIGYITIFEILKETKASLIIDQRQPVKTIIVRFDGNTEFIIF